MRRIITCLLCLVLAAGLCACGAASEAEESELVPMEPAEQAPTVEEIMAASESEAAVIAAAEPPASETDAEVDEEAYTAAVALVGMPVESLYEAIGEPADAQYAASCEEENAEDGMLFYDGFYVWTVRTETEELIHDVYTMD